MSLFFCSPSFCSISSYHQSIVTLFIMEDQAPVFNYLGEEMMQQHLVDITNSIQKCFAPGSAQYNTLAKYSEKIVQKQEKWPDKIFTTWQNRTLPVYSFESITKCNQARVSQIEFANEQRKRLQTEPEKQAILLKSKHFKREPIDKFAAAVIRFESLYVFWLQLDTPHSVDTIRLMSHEVLRQIT